MSQPRDQKFFWQKNFPDVSSSLSGEELAQATNLEIVDRQALSTVVRRPSVRANSRMFQETKLIIGIPVHNSETSIAKTVVGLRPLNVDIIVCDDFSTDATEEIVRELGCKVIKHPKELGFSDCVTSLFLAARRVHASYLLTVDAGMNFTLRDVLNLLEKVQSGECDIAIGSDYSRDEVYSSETADRVRDTYSLFRAYGKRALGLIAPAGTTSVVMEYDVLDFAQQQGLKVKEYPISSADLSKEKPRSVSSKLRSISNKIETSLNRTLSLVAFKHPLLFFGTPALAMLIAAGFQTVETLQFWRSGAQLSTGFSYAGFDLVVSLILGVGALILKSQNNAKTISRN
ncbi:MAG TPA: glycosyltransferase [Nitrososphaerales archaeon]|nr:glycosyltransferase [Nitrososphaerales archaeon]